MAEVVELRIPARLEYLSTVRRMLEAALGPEWPADRVADFVLAVSEAATNAIEAQPPDGRAQSVAVRCTLDGAEVAVVIEDNGPGLDPSGLQGPAEHAERGRGLPIMRALSDDLVVQGSPSGTRVRLLLRR